MTIIPIGNRVLVEPTKKKEETASGIIIPTEEKETRTGIVIGLGRGEDIERSDLFIGDVVLYNKWGEEDLENGKKIIELKNILAIIKE